MYSPRARAHKQRGVATIEFAICAPVLFLMMLATAELGRAMFQYNTLVKTVRDGARYVATNAAVGTTRVVSISTDRRNETINLVRTGNVAGTGAALLPGLGTVEVADAHNGFVSVSAEYTYTPMLGAQLPSFGFGDPIDLAMTFHATILMRAL